MQALAHAKVNLSLRVDSLAGDGYHPLHGVFQSISWSDRLELAPSDEDRVTAWDGGTVADDTDNLAWRAVTIMRAATDATQRLHLRLQKEIPIAAGLGGGSADAAAALQLSRRMLGGSQALAEAMAPQLGSDVPFCLSGGTALVEGRGEIVTPLEPHGGYGLALVVPPIELATPRVYAAWDRLGAPVGPRIAVSDLPPVLRPHAPLVNDLYPAAVSLAPHLDDWRDELGAAWGRPVMMSGSGPTLFGLFVDRDEAEAALDVIPRGARAVHAAEPLPVGWRIED